MAIKQKVVPSTQNQAFNALLFLHEQVLEISIKNENIQALRAKKKIHVAIVLTQEEVAIVIHNMKGVYRLMLSLMYGGGLHIKDIDFGFDNIYIFDSKSQSDRTLPLPNKIKDELKLHIDDVCRTHTQDLNKLLTDPTLIKKYHRTHLGILMPLICYKMGLIFDPFKSYLDIRIFPLR
ncbi:Integron integrase IntIPac [uncultured Candidatus Thioglobus sp.]|nr:Integron integrase IntIPac [uncultured Candidatus Thioglobus sp.]